MAAAIEFRDVVISASPSQPEGDAVSGSRGARRILDGITLTLQQGTTTALLGRSGSGKTTLLRSVNGLVMPSSGSVMVNGEPVTGSDLLRLRRGIGYVIQETGLYPHMSVARNVTMPMELAGAAAADRKQRANDLLDIVGLPHAEFAERMPWQLSGGQRQRAGVARALASDPAILLLDEPFGALDPLTRAEMQMLLRDLLQRLHTTAVIVTHDLGEAIFLADRVLFVHDGRIVADLAADEVLASPDPSVQEYVRSARRFEESR